MEKSFDSCLRGVWFATGLNLGATDAGHGGPVIVEWEGAEFGDELIVEGRIDVDGMGKERVGIAGVDLRPCADRSDA